MANLKNSQISFDKSAELLSKQFEQLANSINSVQSSAFLRGLDAENITTKKMSFGEIVQLCIKGTSKTAKDIVTELWKETFNNGSNEFQYDKINPEKISDSSSFWGELQFYVYENNNNVINTPLLFIRDPRIDIKNDEFLDFEKTDKEFNDITSFVQLTYKPETSTYALEMTQIVPSLYYNKAAHCFCWKINGVKTNISAQGLAGKDGNDATIKTSYLIEVQAGDTAPVQSYIAADKTGFDDCYIAYVSGQDGIETVDENTFSPGQMTIVYKYAKNGGDTSITYGSFNTNNCTLSDIYFGTLINYNDKVKAWEMAANQGISSLSQAAGIDNLIQSLVSYAVKTEIGGDTASYLRFKGGDSTRVILPIASVDAGAGFDSLESNDIVIARYAGKMQYPTQAAGPIPQYDNYSNGVQTLHILGDNLNVRDGITTSKAFIPTSSPAVIGSDGYYSDYLRVSTAGSHGQNSVFFSTANDGASFGVGNTGYNSTDVSSGLMYSVNDEYNSLQINAKVGEQNSEVKLISNTTSVSADLYVKTGNSKKPYNGALLKTVRNTNTHTSFNIYDGCSHSYILNQPNNNGSYFCTYSNDFMNTCIGDGSLSIYANNTSRNSVSIVANTEQPEIMFGNSVDGMSSLTCNGIYLPSQETTKQSYKLNTVVELTKTAADEIDNGYAGGSVVLKYSGQQTTGAVHKIDSKLELSPDKATVSIKDIAGYTHSVDILNIYAQNEGEYTDSNDANLIKSKFLSLTADTNGILINKGSKSATAAVINNGKIVFSNRTRAPLSSSDGQSETDIINGGNSFGSTEYYTTSFTTADPIYNYIQFNSYDSKTAGVTIYGAAAKISGNTADFSTVDGFGANANKSLYIATKAGIGIGLKYRNVNSIGQTIGINAATGDICTLGKLSFSNTASEANTIVNEAPGVINLIHIPDTQPILYSQESTGWKNDYIAIKQRLGGTNSAIILAVSNSGAESNALSVTSAATYIPSGNNISYKQTTVPNSIDKYVKFSTTAPEHEQFYIDKTQSKSVPLCGGDFLYEFNNISTTTYPDFYYASYGKELSSFTVAVKFFDDTNIAAYMTAYSKNHGSHEYSIIWQYYVVRKNGRVCNVKIDNTNDAIPWKCRKAHYATTFMQFVNTDTVKSAEFESEWEQYGSSADYWHTLCWFSKYWIYDMLKYTNIIYGTGTDSMLNVQKTIAKIQDYIQKTSPTYGDICVYEQFEYN